LPILADISGVYTPLSIASTQRYPIQYRYLGSKMGAIDYLPKSRKMIQF